MSGRSTSRPLRTGSLDGALTASLPIGPGSCEPGSAGRSRRLVVVFDLVPVEAGAHGGQVTRRALETVLAAHAGHHFRHGHEASGGNGLLALLADPVVAVPKPLEGFGQTIGALHEQ